MRLFSNKNDLVILNYHRVLENDQKPLSIFDRLSPDEFEKQIIILKKFFEIKPVTEALQSIEKNLCVNNVLSITFDDGYIDCFDKVFPILLKHNIKACFFITTGGMDNGCTWETEIENCVEIAYKNQIKLELFGNIFNLDSIESAINANKTITDLLKYKKIKERTMLLDNLKTQIKYFEQETEYMTCDQVKILSDYGMEIGSHTVNHPILLIEDEQTVYDEIKNAKYRIESILNKSIEIFAFPNGKYNKDFNKKTLEIVKEIGIKYAFSSDWGVNNSEKLDILKIKRIMPWDKNIFMFVIRIYLAKFLN